MTNIKKLQPTTTPSKNPTGKIKEVQPKESEKEKRKKKAPTATAIELYNTCHTNAHLFANGFVCMCAFIVAGHVIRFLSFDRIKKKMITERNHYSYAAV